jgi:hypothetical protein
MGHVVAAVGAIALFVSLFLDWYEPGFSAWTVFELVDVLLAVIAVLVVLAAAEDFLRRPTPPLSAGRWLPGLAAAALLLVVVSIVNNPPAVVDAGEEIGAWIALAGAILIGLGALLAEWRISVVITSTPRAAAPVHEPDDEVEDPSYTPPRQPTGPALEPTGSEAATNPANPVTPRE